MDMARQHRDMLLLQAWIQLQCGHPEQACILLQALLALEEDCIAARRALIVALLWLERGEEAQVHCAWLLSCGENHPVLWLCLGRVHQLAGNLTEARAAWQHYQQRLTAGVADEKHA